MITQSFINSIQSDSGEALSAYKSEIAERLEVIYQEYPQCKLTQAFYLAASSADPTILKSSSNSESQMVRFAVMANSNFTPTMKLLETEPLARYAFACNQATENEILDRIALSHERQNPVIRALVETHPNKSQEVAAFYAMSPVVENQRYDDPEYDFFWEAFGVEGEVDLTAIEALIYLSMLDVVESPSLGSDFWGQAFDGPFPKGMNEVLSFFAKIPEDISKYAEFVVEVRTWAALEASELTEIENLSTDFNSTLTSYGQMEWVDSRSPRNSLILNSNTPISLLREIYDHEIENKCDEAFINGTLWRFAVSEYTPQDILEDLISRVEDGRISDPILVKALLMGQPYDYPFGLRTNKNLTKEQLLRVEALCNVEYRTPLDQQNRANKVAPLPNFFFRRVASFIGAFINRIRKVLK